VGVPRLKGSFVKQVQPVIAAVIFIIGYLMFAVGMYRYFGPIPLIPLGLILAATGALIDTKE
jgi:uncharacterized membrane protein YoaK (UPF0700 family)